MTEAYNGASAEGTQAWTNPSYARGTSADLSYATCLPAKNSSIAGIWKTYGFSIPAGATITKVEVIPRYRFSVNTSIASLRIEVSWNNGTNWGTAHNNTTEYLSDTDSTVDVTADASWTPTNLGNSYFLVRVTAIRESSNTAFTTYLDRVPVRVTYSNDQNITVTETLYSTEASPLKNRDLFPADTVALAEGSMLKNRDLFPADSMGISDQVLKDRDAYITDVLSLADEITKLVALLIQDTAALADSALVDKPLSATDSLGLAESVALDALMLSLENIAATEAALADKEALLAELVALADVPLLDRGITITEALSLASDEQVALLEAIKAVQEALSLAEATPVLDRDALLLEALLLTDSMTKDRDSYLLETITASEDLAVPARGALLLDMVTLTDTGLKDRDAYLLDYITLEDLASKEGESIKAVLDSLLLGDLPLLDRLAALSDSLALTDAMLTDRLLALLDSIELADAADIISEIVKAVLDSVGLTDQVLKDRGMSLEDVLTLVDNGLVEKELLTQDSLSLADLALIVGGTLVEIADSMGLAEDVSFAHLLEHVTRLLGRRAIYQQLQGRKDKNALAGEQATDSIAGQQPADSELDGSQDKDELNGGI